MKKTLKNEKCVFATLPDPRFKDTSQAKREILIDKSYD